MIGNDWIYAYFILLRSIIKVYLSLVYTGDYSRRRQCGRGLRRQLQLGGAPQILFAVPQIRLNSRASARYKCFYCTVLHCKESANIFCTYD